MTFLVNSYAHASYKVYSALSAFPCYSIENVVNTISCLVPLRQLRLLPDFNGDD